MNTEVGNNAFTNNTYNSNYYWCDRPIGLSIAMFPANKTNLYRKTRDHLVWAAENRNPMHEVCIPHCATQDTSRVRTARVKREERHQNYYKTIIYLEKSEVTIDLYIFP